MDSNRELNGLEQHAHIVADVRRAQEEQPCYQPLDVGKTMWNGPAKVNGLRSLSAYSSVRQTWALSRQTDLLHEESTPRVGNKEYGPTLLRD
jgi:hypothetical protein